MWKRTETLRKPALGLVFSICRKAPEYARAEWACLSPLGEVPRRGSEGLPPPLGRGGKFLENLPLG